MIEGGSFELIQKLMDKCKKKVRFNTRVQSIDYSGDSVRVHTTNGLYFAYKVISSLPLGVLKHEGVKFNPELPENCQKALQ